MRRPVVVVVLVVTAVAALGSIAPAHAADAEVAALLEQARREKAALRYEDGLATLERARRLGRSGPAELREIHRGAGELAAGLDDEATATIHFERWLALEPEATLPAGTSPKLLRPFEAARAWLAARPPLRVRFEVAPGGASLLMIVDGDPLAMVVGARARVRVGGAAAGETRVEARGGGRVELRLPAGESLHVVAAAFDEHGNELVVHGSWEVPIVVAGAPARPRPGAPSAARPLYARWWFWGLTGVALGGAGLVFGERMNVAQDEFDAMTAGNYVHTLAEAEAVERRGRRWAVAANVSFVAAGATGIAAVVLMVRDAYGREASGLSVAPAASPGGGGLGFVVSGSF